MKSKFYLCLLVTFFYTAITVNGQKPVYPIPNSIDQIPFGKKLPPPPSLNLIRKGSDQTAAGTKLPASPYTTFDPVTKSYKLVNSGRMNNDYQRPLPSSGMPGQPSETQKNTSANFHLTKDINSLSESLPTNNGIWHFAILNNISYFSANDGIHGRELWRSDGTALGTYLVKDINPGEAGSDVTGGIIAANGLLYFSAATPDNGFEPWVSDGTEAGTHLLVDLNLGPVGSNPNQFVNVNGSVFFIASLYSNNNQIWKTDGSETGTVLVKDLQQTGIGYSILELTAVNDMAYFIASTFSYGYQLFRSDGTDAGTYIVKQIGSYLYDYSAPMQLTAYNNKLYFSVDDGTGRRLWTSDGTTEGTGYAAGYNDVFIEQFYVNINTNTPFLILNNVLFIPGFTPAEGGGLYKYDASNADGIVLVKDFTPEPDIEFISPSDMCVVNDAIFFKVVNSTSEYHDELWSTKGEPGNTQLVKLFNPGDITYGYNNGGGTLFFNEYDNINGNELWKSDGTGPGTLLVTDINPGSGGSYPGNLTFCNGKLLFSAENNIFGNELWTSDGTDVGTSLVKDINTTTTNNSDAGFFYKGIGSDGNVVVFGAFTRELGGELYKSNGTSAGTKLLNDIAEGESWSYPNSFRFKNGFNYFIGDNLIGTSIYKTDGTKGGLQQIVYNIDRVVYYVTNFNVTDNGLPFYILANRNTGAYELWRSDGTEAGTYALSTSLYFNSYIVTVGNAAFFVAGDIDHGFELWKSDGTLAGTKMVKDINPGFNGSYPYSLFAYEKDVYFGAGDGGLNNSLWKTDGTRKGTVKLKNITPAFYDYNNNFGTQYFCISNGILYFDATDFNEYGAELWKTNGTKAGTKLVKDIIPSYPFHSYPANLTDVNGVLYFTADDGIHGSELWSSSGKSRNTKLVKDITPDFGGSYLVNLCSAGGKLYFLNNGVVPNTLWSSDGTDVNTTQVADDGLAGLSNLTQLTPAGKKLFFGAFSTMYGTELYVGDACATTFTAARVSSRDMVAAKTNSIFDVLLYPNPVHGMAALQIKGGAKNITVTIADISGKTIWLQGFNNQSTIYIPVEKLSVGLYLVTVISDIGSKSLKLVKQ